MDCEKEINCLKKKVNDLSVKLNKLTKKVYQVDSGSECDVETCENNIHYVIDKDDDDISNFSLSSFDYYADLGGNTRAFNANHIVHINIYNSYDRTYYNLKCDDYSNFSNCTSRVPYISKTRYYNDTSYGYGYIINLCLDNIEYEEFFETALKYAITIPNLEFVVFPIPQKNNLPYLEIGIDTICKFMKQHPNTLDYVIFYVKQKDMGKFGGVKYAFDKFNITRFDS